MLLKDKYKTLIKELETYFEHDYSGHDWYHVLRVLELSLKLSEKEGGNKEVIFLAALLHDVGDHKFHNGDYSVAPKLQQAFLEKHKVSLQLQKNILSITANISYSKNSVEDLSLEGKIVQDADRLDAMGHMGIARCFAYGGTKNRPIFSPNNSANSLQHFDDKLLKLQALLNTETAKDIGRMRHKVISDFKEGFINEWNTVLNE